VGLTAIQLDHYQQFSLLNSKEKNMKAIILTIVGIVGGFILGTAVISVAAPAHHSVQRSTTSTDGHVQVDHIDICTANLGDHWQAAWSAYNVFHGGSIVTPANGGYLDTGDPQWSTLSAATQQKWENVVDAAEQRECHPIVP
jgi:hypothetical protein